MRLRKSNAWRILFLIWITGFVVLNTGCIVRGFSTIPDGPATVGQLRAGATVARAEASALDELADEQEGAIRRAVAMTQQAADQLGAPAIVSGLIGAGAGFLLPSPGDRRKREELAGLRAKDSANATT